MQHNCLSQQFADAVLPFRVVQFVASVKHYLILAHERRPFDGTYSAIPTVKPAPSTIRTPCFAAFATDFQIA
jgi:hypothetical protein